MEENNIRNTLPSTEVEPSELDIVNDSSGGEYLVYLEDIRDSIDLGNAINVGLIFFVGMIFGLLFMWLFWQRFK